VSLAPYRRVLARPGLPAVLLLALLARIPITAAPVVLTLHVVLDLHRGFAQAGLLGAVFAVGGAVGAPLLGRGIDRVGLRPVLVVTTVVEGAFWLAAPHLGFAWLLAAGLVAGLLAIPVFSLSRQAVSAMCPPEERQAGFSLDSMGVELSFAVGPAAGIWLLTATDARTTLLTVAAMILAAGTALFVLDPPVRGDDARLPAAARLAPAPPAGSGAAARWLTTPVLGLLLVTVAATFTVAGTDTALTAVMTDFGRVDRLGLVFAIWCLAYLVGGFVFGASGRRFEPVLVLAALAVLCLPVALAGTWQALALLVVPTGLFCAPVMSLTAEVLTRTTPAGARGLVLGVHSSALTVGNAVGAPVTGLVVDAVDPRLGFVAIGVLGLVLAGLARAVGRSGTGAGAPADPPLPSRVLSGAGQE
jgi:MFS family permease